MTPLPIPPKMLAGGHQEQGHEVVHHDQGVHLHLTLVIYYILYHIYHISSNHNRFLVTSKREKTMEYTSSSLLGNEDNPEAG